MTLSWADDTPDDIRLGTIRLLYGYPVARLVSKPVKIPVAAMVAGASVDARHRNRRRLAERLSLKRVTPSERGLAKTTRLL